MSSTFDKIAKNIPQHIKDKVDAKFDLIDTFENLYNLCFSVNADDRQSVERFEQKRGALLEKMDKILKPE